MKSQGTGLWLLAIGLIAAFMLATMIAPALLNSQTSDDGGTNDGGGTPPPLTFQAPSVELGRSSIDRDDTTSLALRTIASSSTTGEGGSFIWVLSIQGADGSSPVQARYDGKEVQWYRGDDGKLTGVGPRFSQGPGATPVEVPATFNLTALATGTYTIEAWVAVAGQVVTLDPTGLKASSAASSVTLQINEKPVPKVTVDQTLSGPTSTREDRAVDFTLSSKATTSGKWNGSLTDHISITKSKIGTSDVRVEVNGKGITLKDIGDRLEADLQTVKPFKGEEKTETAEWTVTITITFQTTGTYMIEGSCLDSVSKKVLSTTDGFTVNVTGSSSRSSTSPVSNNTTTQTDSGTAPAAPTVEPVTTPLPPADEGGGDENGNANSGLVQNNSTGPPISGP